MIKLRTTREECERVQVGEAAVGPNRMGAKLASDALAAHELQARIDAVGEIRCEQYSGKYLSGYSDALINVMRILRGDS